MQYVAMLETGLKMYILIYTVNVELHKAIEDTLCVAHISVIFHVNVQQFHINIDIRIISNTINLYRHKLIKNGA
jgi:hypothetical protein